MISARGAPIWYQLYTTNNWDITQKLVKRAERAGCPVVAITVDLPNGRNTETQARFQKLDTRVCANCHVGADRPNADPTGASTKPMFTGIDTTGISITSPSLTWDFIRRLKGNHACIDRRHPADIATKEEDDFPNYRCGL